MAKHNSADVNLWLVDGNSLAVDLGTISEGSEQETEDTTGHGVSWPRHSPTLKGHTVEVEGWYDDATAATHEALSEKQGVTRTMMFGVEGQALGDAVTMSNGAVQASYNRITAVGGVTKLAASMTLSGEVEDGVLIAAVASRGADGNTESTSHDNAASSADGASAHLQCTALALGGYTNVVAKVRHSADNITFADLITFTALTAIGAERKTVAGTVNRYTAISWAWGGAGSSQSFTPAIGLHRN